MANWYYNTLPAGTPSPDRLIAHGNPTTGDLQSATNAQLFYNNDNSSLFQQRLNQAGSVFIAHAGGLSPLIFGSNIGLAGGILYFTPVPIPNATLTGIYFNPPVSAAYTANNYNGFGLYSRSGSTLTLIASTANSDTPFKTASVRPVRVPFTSPLTVTADIYYIAMIVSWSAFTIQPQAARCTSATAEFICNLAYPYDYPIIFRLSSITALPSTVNLATVSTNSANLFWCGVY